MFRKLCRKHSWSSEVRWGKVRCLNCPRTMDVEKLEQLRRMAAQRKLVNAIRKEN